MAAPRPHDANAQPLPIPLVSRLAARTRAAQSIRKAPKLPLPTTPEATAAASSLARRGRLARRGHLLAPPYRRRIDRYYDAAPPEAPVCVCGGAWTRREGTGGRARDKVETKLCSHSNRPRSSLHPRFGPKGALRAVEFEPGLSEARQVEGASVEAGNPFPSSLLPVTSLPLSRARRRNRKKSHRLIAARRAIGGPCPPAPRGMRSAADLPTASRASRGIDPGRRARRRRLEVLGREVG